jgi:diguanylate cyclase (GGDEF)-like protein
VLSISEDITDRHLAEQRLIYLATHDTLTGLGNRALLQERLGAAWASHENSDYMLALLFIDLDGFKEINDTRGHSIGDELLRQVAGVLQSIVPETNTIARVGGDEFIVLLDKVIGIESVTALAEDIRIRCSQPFYVSDIEVFLSASIGISTFPGPVEHPQALLRTADIAMYHAKGSGRNTFALYSPDMQDKAMKRLEMRNMLRHALERKELVLHYQPRVSLSTGRIVGAEALVRWHSPELGLVSPASFIPLAEESELIRQIGEWVLREACMQASQWQTQGHEPVHIAVNLSTRQLRDAGLLGIIASALEDAGLDPRLLELEVTESAFLEKDPKPLALLNDIHGMDVRLAIDDFGTGYSNLSYLKRLPIDVLKIDQSFIRGVTSDRNDRAIVDTIMALADSLALKVIAEGVETDTQRTLLKTLGCSEYQGFVFSKPLPLPDFSALLAVSRRACD